MLCPDPAALLWTALAVIRTVESGNGTSNLPEVHSGSNADGAGAPMQFERSKFTFAAEARDSHRKGNGIRHRVSNHQSSVRVPARDPPTGNGAI
jgi:hypothetical protein